ncbi:glycosyltransferase [Flavobacterium sp. TP390]|uniref:Glycosyltransferase n=1 Tax=Flavobacterium profundi TaxID=1774945 RepID=A0A6I4IUU3_9FLAO|nr:glycosyltransferase family 2 protein [Flavobacterium profundi]MVO10611.1 glycosyltransferase [Flavobacterium profundi]
MAHNKKVICLTPVYNDWESFKILIQKIESLYFLESKTIDIQVIAINDGSSLEFFDDNFTKVPFSIVNLKKNVGHQRAIAIGLQYINDQINNFDYVVVLDSDGEDRPEDIITLLQKAEALNSKKIIFAQRKKRQESLVFKIGYFFYKQFFYFLTKQKINFGNFSCIPAELLKKIIVQENLWNHYSGSIIQSKIPFDKILLDRGKRYAGESKMNFTSLVLHGLSSIAVYFDILSVRILKFTFIGVSICIFSVLVVLYFKFFTDQSVPGWASNLLLIIFNIILQLFLITLIVLLMQLSSRKNIIPPKTDIYKDFID